MAGHANIICKVNHIIEHHIKDDVLEDFSLICLHMLTMIPLRLIK